VLVVEGDGAGVQALRLGHQVAHHLQPVNRVCSGGGRAGKSCASAGVAYGATQGQTVT
jgi:hypothetical protein